MTARELGREARRLLLDEQGAEGLEKLLIVGAIVLPLLGILIVFRGRITDLLQSAWGGVSNDLEPSPIQLP